jgi:hypothetical protein
MLLQCRFASVWSWCRLASLLLSESIYMACDSFVNLLCIAACHVRYVSIAQHGYVLYRFGAGIAFKRMEYQGTDHGDPQSSKSSKRQ